MVYCISGLDRLLFENSGKVDNERLKFGTLWNGVERYGTVWNGVERCGTVWNGMERCGTVGTAGSGQ